MNGVDPLGLMNFNTILKDFFSEGIEGVRLSNQATNHAIDRQVEKVTGPKGVEWGGEGRTFLDGPKKGNWGGKMHSGGPDGNLPPTDSADAEYRKHDFDYDRIKRTPILGDVTKTQKKMLRKADDDLVSSLKRLPKKSQEWDEPPAHGDERGAEWFRDKALWWFKK